MRPKRWRLIRTKGEATGASMLLLAVTVIVAGACSPKRPPIRTTLTPVVATVAYGELAPEMAPFEQAIASSKLGYIGIIADKHSEVTPWSSKLGGSAYFLKGQAYPTGPDGVPLVLLAQLNFSEIPRLEGYPSQGILQFFIAGGESGAHVYGMSQEDAKPYSAHDFFASLSKQTWFRVVYHPQTLRERDKLQSPQVPPRAMMLPHTGSTGLRFQSGVEPVSVWDYRFPRIFGKPSEKFFQQFGAKEEIAAINYIAFSNKVHLAKVGGYSSPVQEDPRMIHPAEDWVVLLELHNGSEEGGFNMLWGDGGMAAFYIRPDDLKRLDFSKVVYYWDNH